MYDSLEALRLSFLGIPRYWRSTTLPANHVWANGDFVLFSDWPELKKVYDAGGFAGMLLAYNANSATIAANLGKWRPNAANPTGLYTPKMNERFFQAWTGGEGAGITNVAGIPDVQGQFSVTTVGAFAEGAFSVFDSSAGLLTSNGGSYWHSIYQFYASRYNEIFGKSWTVMPPSVNLPVCIYLGVPA